MPVWKYIRIAGTSGSGRDLPQRVGSARAVASTAQKALHEAHASIPGMARQSIERERSGSGQPEAAELQDEQADMPGIWWQIERADVSAWSVVGSRGSGGRLTHSVTSESGAQSEP